MPAREGIDLNSKFDVESGRILLTGVQALVRLPMLRRRLDLASGLKTAGFISGYRGSPLGGYDAQLQAARARLDALDIVVRPAVNEDLGATAIWGTQQVGLHPGARYDGVFGIWYGKAPGVDRSGDVFKHANFAGVSPNGGVLAVAGDDHGAKSSSLAAQSEYNFVDAEIPVFAPASIDEVLSFGVKALEVSRFAGLWTAMTTVAELMDSTAAFDVDPTHYATVRPDFHAMPPDGLHIRLPDTPVAQEVRHRGFRLPAALAFVRANGFDKTPIDPPNARWGILTAGKAYGDVRQALSDLGIDDVVAHRLGLRLYKPGLVWPLDPVGARAFASGLKKVLVIEERRDLVESQLKQVCYSLTRRPVIVGKRDENGRPLIKDVGELTAEDIALAIYACVPDSERTPAMREHIAQLARRTPPAPSLHERPPFFCSGCPHNTSTVVPGGSRAMAGIGCHYMVQTMPRNSQGFTQMGGEGVTWVGQAPFTDERHVFVNLGDGTYFHSGILAIRQAVAAGVNITYKILYNDAVAMTGGQAVDGVLTVPRLVRQLAAEGVGQVIVVSDDVVRTRAAGVPVDIEVSHRDDLEAVQQRLREQPGVTALVYDQTCATELRRRRKRGLVADPGVKMFINTRVCEGCGDCSAQSNCISIEPLDTEFGRKRRIDQSSCNSDLSCRKGFCPSFVTVRGGRVHRPRFDLAVAIADLPAPTRPQHIEGAFNLVLAGVGGQGVSSLSGIIGMAAHIDGLAVRSVDMLGMAQKGGGVFVHLRLARAAEILPRPRIGQGQADLLLANDMVVAHAPGVAGTLDARRTAVVLNAALAPTAEFTTRGDVVYDRAGMTAQLRERARSLREIDAGRIAVEHLGDAIFANMLLLGHAWQLGHVPLSFEALDTAIALNGAAVESNRRAFGLGRLAATPPEGLGTLVPAPAPRLDAPEDVVQRLRDDLISYQSIAYADRFSQAIAAVADAERRAGRTPGTLTLAAARSLHKLMAYKDEYEVARLYADPAFTKAIEKEFGAGARLSLNLAPPVLARTDPATGHLRKQEYGSWVLRLMPLLARLKILRGQWCDPFGGTVERRAEREVRDQFFEVLDEIVAHTATADLSALIELATLPQSLRGYGHVKAEGLGTYRQRLAALRSRMSIAAAASGRAGREAVNP